VSRTLKRGVTSAEGTWEICSQDGGHIQKRARSARSWT
jgi:hypothetical protein